MYAHEFETDGIMVTNEELYRLFLAPDENQQIFGRFDNFQFFKDSTGQFSYQIVKQFISRANAIETPQTTEERRLKDFIRNLEDDVYNTRIQQKFLNVVKAPASLVSANEARFEYGNREKKYDISFLMVNYSSVSDSAVEVNDGDVMNLINARKELYNQDDMVALRYVIFPKLPRSADSTRAISILQNLAPRWAETEDDSSFIAGQTNQTPDTSYRTRDLLPVVLRDAFSKADSINENQVFGPFLDGNVYKLFKVTGKKADANASANIRHIQFNFQGTSAADTIAARNKADGIRRTLQGARTRFAEIAADTSDDMTTKDTGGDLGWVGEKGSYGPKFDEALKNAKPGDVYVTESNRGFHVVEMLERDDTGFQVGEIPEEIFAGDKTVQAIYNEAKDMARKIKQGGGLQVYADKDSTIQVMESPPIDKTKYDLGGIKGGLGIIHWAFSAKEGEFADKIFSCDDAFVLAEVSKKREKGTQSVEDTRDNLGRIARNRKKADIIMEKINGVFSNNLEKIKEAYGPGAEILTASGISFSSPTINGIGADPWIIGRICGMVKDEISKPVAGDAGVVVIRIDAITEPGQMDESTLSSERDNVRFSKISKLEGGVTAGLRKLADVQDLRYQNSVFLNEN